MLGNAASARSAAHCFAAFVLSALRVLAIFETQWPYALAPYSSLKVFAPIAVRCCLQSAFGWLVWPDPLSANAAGTATSARTASMAIFRMVSPR